jgi:hypothetical protein
MRFGSRSPRGGGPQAYRRGQPRPAPDGACRTGHAPAPGTAVNAVTAAKLKVIPAGDGTSTIVLSGTDGATYSYRNVAASMVQRTRVNAGTQIGVIGPGGLTFSISAPDVRGAVDAGEALQAWPAGSASMSGLCPPPSPLPLSRRPAGRCWWLPTRERARPRRTRPSSWLATWSGCRPTRSATPVPSVVRLPRHSRSRLQAASDWWSSSWRTGRQPRRRRSRHRCPQAMRWVAPPGTTPKQAAAYREIIAARPGFLVESLPAALAAVNAPAVNGLLGGHGQPVPEAGRRPARWRLPRSWPPTHPPADRLEPVSTQAHTVVSWAEEQMGKPYQWGQPGRAASTAPG